MRWLCDGFGLLLLLSAARRAAPEASSSSSSAAAAAACPEQCDCFAERGESFIDCSERNVTEIPLPIEDLRYVIVLLT